MFSTNRLLSSMALASAVCVIIPASAQTTVTAVNFGGDFGTGNANSSLDESGQVIKDFADFDGDTNLDARFRIPVDHGGFFFGSNSGTIDPNINAFWNTGLEVINYGQATPSDGTVGAVFRLNGSGRTNDRIQVGSAASTGTSTGLVAAPHVRKNAFLGGASGGETVSFTDDATGFFWDWNWQNGSANVPIGGTRQTRATVKNGDTWYYSDTASSARGNTPNDGLSFNPFTETWFEYNVNTSLFIDTGVAVPEVGTSVLGSTFNDIQALGVMMQVNSDNDTANNGIVANLDTLSVSLDFTVPPPPVPVEGFAIVDWDMDTVLPSVTTTDQFGITFTAPAVIDGSNTPNPGLVSGEMNDPLFLGDATPDLGDRFPVGTRPVQTTNGGGVGGGEALSFDGVDDEAIGVIAWLADSNEQTFIPNVDGVYVNLDFKEVENTGQGIQNIASAGSVWRLQIDDDGNLEWLTFLEGGGNDTIEVALGEEGDWRNVEAFHNPDGSKGLYLDGELVAQSQTGQLHIDRHSILLGNLENTTNYYAGLIDNVFVGTGILGALLGDFDTNGVLELADLELLYDEVALGNNPEAFDLTDPADGAVDSSDLAIWVETLFGSALGDLDLDGDVDIVDFGTFAANFGTSVSDYGLGDLDGDGDNDIVDFGTFAAGFGFGVDLTTEELALFESFSASVTSTIPEPTSLALLSLGGLAALRRRRA